MKIIMYGILVDYSKKSHKNLQLKGMSVILQHSFVGTWRLVSFESQSEDGTVTYPLGTEAKGYIMYNPDSYMSVAIMRADRPNFTSGDPANGTLEEYVAASQYLSYAGRYDVKENSVFHYLDVSFFPNMIGSVQKRNFVFSGKRLILTADPIIMYGKLQTSVITWERV